MKASPSKERHTCRNLPGGLPQHRQPIKNEPKSTLSAKRRLPVFGVVPFFANLPFGKPKMRFIGY